MGILGEARDYNWQKQLPQYKCADIAQTLFLFLPAAEVQLSSALINYCNLISTSTPAGKSSFINASTVLSVGSTMSIRRTWVRISN